MNGMDDMSGMGGMMMAVSGLVGLAVLTLAVIGSVWMVRRMSGGRSSHVGAPESPDQLLRRRYAAGEIDEDDYLRRRAGLIE